MTGFKRHLSENFSEYLVFGAASSVPTVRLYGRSTPSPQADSNTNYEAMKPEAYRWFRQDENVRRCILVNAAYATMAPGFETELEPIEELKSDAAKKAFQEKYKFVKDYVDAANRAVNMDKVLFIADIKRCIFGNAAFEIQTDAMSAPAWMLSLDSRRVKPDLSEAWALLGYKWDDAPKTEWKVEAHRLLYFTNLELEGDREGLSEVEPIYSIVRARHNLLRRDFPEISRTLWAPYVVLSADTAGMTKTARDAFLDDLVAAAESGKSIAVSRQVNATVVAIQVDFDGLVKLLDVLDAAVIRNFGTPRFLVNKPTENRATAYTEFEAYDGSTLEIKRAYFKRELEAQWYPELVKRALVKESMSGTVPVKVRHVWNKIQTQDFIELAKAIAGLFGNGLGILAEDPEIAYDMMRWKKDKLLERLEEQKKLMKQQQQQGPEGEGREPGLPGEEKVDDKGKTS